MSIQERSQRRGGREGLKSFLAPALMLLAVAIVFSLPFLSDFSNWGRHDWDQFLFFNGVARTTLLEYHQLPLWNPYSNGGNVFWAHPFSMVLSPSFILILIFGTVGGLKIQIVGHLFIGMLGMYFLGRRFRFSPIACYLPPLVFMLSAVFAQHVAEGHVIWIWQAYFPWLFLCYEKRSLFGGAIVLALMHFVGSVNAHHISFLFLFVYAAAQAVQKKSAEPLKALLLIFAGAALLSAVKLLPVLEFMYMNPRGAMPDDDGTGLRVLFRMLLGRDQALYSLEAPVMKRGWHEYGAYVGIFPLLLSALGVRSRGRRYWPLLAAGSACLLIVMGSQSPLNLWGILQHLPLYGSVRVPSRYILGFVFCVAMFSGAGLTRLEEALRGPRWRARPSLLRALTLVCVVAVLLDLWSVNSPIMANVFETPPLDLGRHEKFRIRYGRFHPPGFDNYSAMYPVLLSNSGIIRSYEDMWVAPGKIRSVHHPRYRGEAYISGSEGGARVVFFSPNKIVVEVDVLNGADLVINQNHYRGWWVLAAGIKRARRFKGLLSTPVLPGRSRVTFYFFPLSFFIGACVSAGFILTILCRGVRSRRRAAGSFFAGNLPSPVGDDRDGGPKT